MRILKTMGAAVLMLFGIPWSLVGLLGFAEGVYRAITTTTPADQASASAELFQGLALFGIGTAGAWGGVRLWRAARPPLSSPRT